MNFIFISPNFPENYYHFCESLRNRGIKVLGIGDAFPDNLNNDIKNSLDEYYYVPSLEVYENVRNAVSYYINKYGKIDFLESNNEYWLLQDAKLRTEFNIDSGIKEDEIEYIKSKSAMKKLYEEAGIKTARYHKLDDLENTKRFIELVGYPVVIKPDMGVGAIDTFKINTDSELEEFFGSKPEVEMIVEEFVNGDLVSYDGIANSKREIIYEASHVFPRQIMDVVNEKLDCFYWSIRNIPDDLREAGRRVVSTFMTNSRCFHLEFFILKEDKEGLGNKGDIIGLEVNMRTPGGFTPDMMNFASDINIYDIYADMIYFDKTEINASFKKYYCVYASRRKEHQYIVPLGDVASIYKTNVIASIRNTSKIARAIGDDALIARFEDREDIWPFINAVVEDNK